MTGVVLRRKGVKRQWPADQVTRRPVADLVPSARNARTHSDAQITQIANSIERWGWTVAVIVDESGEIIAGHGRVLAAERLGIESVPVVVAGDWSDDEKRAYAIADNQLALNAAWNDDMLRSELADLSMNGFDVSLIGIPEEDMAALADPDPEPKSANDEKRFLLMLEFDSERALERAFEEAQERGIPCKIIE